MRTGQAGNLNLAALSMADQMPVELSLIIPTFNRAGLLRLAVNSAIATLPERCEILVADDRSDPPAADVLADIDHRTLRFSVNAGNRGASANRNQAVRAAKGNILLFLDDDDLMIPSYPALVLETAKANPDIAWGFSTTIEHAEGVKTVGSPFLGGFEPTDTLPFKRRLTGLGCGVWVRREVFLSLGGIDEGLAVNEDTDFCLKLLSAGHTPLRSATPGVSLLRNAETGLTKGTPAADRMQFFRMILDRHSEYLQDEPSGHRHIMRRYLKFAAKSRHLSVGLHASITEGPLAVRPLNTLYFMTNFLIYAVIGDT